MRSLQSAPQLANRPAALICAVALQGLTATTVGQALAGESPAPITQAISLNSSQFDAAFAHNAINSELALTLPDGEAVTLQVSTALPRRHGDAVAGVLLGETLSDFTLVRVEQRVAGIIRSPRLGVIALYPLDAQRCELRRVDCGIATCGQPLYLPIQGVAPEVEPIVRGGMRASPGCDDGSVIDVLVVYTAQARVGAGGTANIQALIDLAIADTNAAFLRSEVGVSLSLVHREEVVYTETGNSDIDGPRLLDPQDGFLDNVHVLREQHRADLVAFWVQNFEYGGRVFGPVEPSGYYGFHIMRQDNAVIGTMAHETGHNLGCAHDRENSFNDAYFDYSYGYRAPGSSFRTIMAYAPGTPIPYFANPNVNYLGQPTGIPEGQPLPCDTARTMSQTSLIVANYRNAAVGGLPARLYVNAATGSGGNGLSWATAYRDLQDALCAARRSGGTVDEVWVAGGVYRPDMGSGLRQMSFRLVDGVALYGGFAGTETLLAQRDRDAHPTILSGDIGVAVSTSDNSQHVVVAEDVDATAQLDGFFVEGGIAVVSNSYFVDLGGGIAIRRASPVIRNCVIRNNSAARGAGAVLDDDSNPLFEAVTFESNVASSRGGAAYVRNGSSGTFTSCHFEANDAESGGALYLLQANSTVLGGSFEGNSADEGGAITADNAAPLVASSMFYLNTAVGSGGAVKVFGAGSAQFQSCDFEQNFAAYGGAVQSNGNVELLSCTFLLNGASENGGAIDSAFGATNQIDFSVFEQNFANWGGAINLYQADIELTSSTLTGNHSDNGGGGLIFGQGAGYSVTACDFSQNDADFGGAIYVYNVGAGTFRDCGIYENIAYDGAGAYHYDSQPQYARCVFDGNVADSTGGGVIDFLGAAGFAHCEFSGNFATYGAAAAAWGAAQTQYVNCGYFGNVAAWSGGAFQNDGAAAFFGCVMSGNQASGSHGGALTNAAGASCALTNCTLAYNVAGWLGGGIATDPPHVSLRNSIVWANSDSFASREDGQVYHFDATHSDFQWTTVQHWSGAWSGVGNNGSSPGFVDSNGPDNVPGTSDDDLRLGGTSPLIDSAANALAAVDLLDIDGDLDTAEFVPTDYDGNARFWDVATVADTGSGAAPLIDRGYAEAAPVCPGDIDGDNQVSITDLAVLLSNFGSTGSATLEDGDFDGDADVDIQDLAFILSLFGVSC